MVLFLVLWFIFDISLLLEYAKIFAESSEISEKKILKGNSYES